jgi:uncharacterized protein YxjI
MPITAVCQCGASYTLKDEFGGKSIKCPKCNNSFVVPASTRAPQAEPVFDRDKFLIRQKRVAISQKYFVGDEQGNELLFVHRPAALGQGCLMVLGGMGWLTLCIVISVFLSGDAPGKPGNPIIFFAGIILGVAGMFGIIYALAPKRHVTFYADQAMSRRLMMVRQDFKMAFLNAAYTLLDAANQPLCVFRKNYLYNIIRKRWYIEDPNGRMICVAMEDSILLSLLRRFLGPMFGLLRTNFIITTPDCRDVLGEFNRKFTLFDRYVLDMTHDPQRTLDRRICLALGVMLDTGETR